MAAVGILGGTFNPPHIGHLVCAQEARAQLGLDRVVLMPVHTPPHKEAIDDPGPQARLALCRAAIGEDEELELSTLEIERGGPSYTVDTLRALHESREGDDLTFIVGGDMARAGDMLLEPAIAGLRRHVLADSTATPVIVAALAERASLIGALTLAIDATDLTQP